VQCHWNFVERGIKHHTPKGSLWAADSRHWHIIIRNATLKELKRITPPLKCRSHFVSWAVAAARNRTHLLSDVSSEKLFWENPIAGSWPTTISHFWDRPVPIFSNVRFSYLALVEDKKVTCVLSANACCTVYVNYSPCFSVLK
jgi:hypothetical protein